MNLPVGERLTDKDFRSTVNLKAPWQSNCTQTKVEILPRVDQFSQQTENCYSLFLAINFLCKKDYSACRVLFFLLWYRLFNHEVFPPLSPSADGACCPFSPLTHWQQWRRKRGGEGKSEENVGPGRGGGENGRRCAQMGKGRREKKEKSARLSSTSKSTCRFCRHRRLLARSPSLFI